MIFRQLFDSRSSTYTYVLADDATRDAVIIDPVFEQFRRDAALVDELALTVRWVLDTHVHADHVTAAWLWRTRRGARSAVAAAAGATADRQLVHGDVIDFGQRSLTVRAVPGHTDGCLAFVLDGATDVFTGDSLMIRSAGRADFQQGDARRLYRSVHAQLFTLPDTCNVWPGHDYQGRSLTTIAEERAHNPRVGADIAEDDCALHMANLNLPHPNLIDIAVPANLRGGEPAAGQAPPQDPTWAPLRFTFAGVWEVDPRWLEEHAAEVHIVDVREPDELTGELGSIANVTAIPLGQLAARAATLPTDKPTVCVCRSGSRSAQAANILTKAGVKDVANLAGGMLRWRALGLRVVARG